MYQLAPDEERRDCGLNVLDTYFNNGVRFLLTNLMMRWIHFYSAMRQVGLFHCLFLRYFNVMFSPLTFFFSFLLSLLKWESNVCSWSGSPPQRRYCHMTTETSVFFLPEVNLKSRLHPCWVFVPGRVSCLCQKK